MEDVGYEYFNELVSTSFFQRSSGQELFGMHDLVHDIAKYVSRGHCIILQDDSSKDAIANVHHASVRYLDSPMRYDSIITEATHLRTIFPLFPTSYRYLSNEVVNLVILNLMYLRVLSFHGCVTVKELSESIGELKHLRFLRLSHTRIERLPRSMSLQTLTDYIAGKDNATNIGELRELSDLHGQLCLQNLENVAKASDASDAKLVDKKYLEALHLDWKGDDKDRKHDRDVLDNLLPHTNLKRLTVHGYGGTSFPDWLRGHTFSNIWFLRLENCKYCNSLPPLGQLPSLETLEIHVLNRVVNVGAEFYGFNSSNNSVRKPFASLRILSFNNMSAWKKWSSIEVEEGGEVFHKLQELRIINCDKLTTVDWPRKLPCLTKLIIKGSSVGIVSSLPRTPALLMLKLGKCEKLKLEELSQTVQSIKVGGCNGVESLMKILKKSQSGSHPNLQRLHIHNCSSPTTLPTGCLPSTLTQLKIKNSNCRKLIAQRMKWNLQTFQSLSSFTIVDEFGNVESFPEEGLLPTSLTVLWICGFPHPKRLEELKQLTSLKNLRIWRCPQLHDLPQQGCPTSLAYLDIRECPILKERCQIDKGQDWNNISNIFRIDIDGDRIIG
nr:putative disease resistance protein At3g14460 [Ziziphus jujuba var. spinosa]